MRIPALRAGGLVLLVALCRTATRLDLDTVRAAVGCLRTTGAACGLPRGGPPGRRRRYLRSGPVPRRLAKEGVLRTKKKPTPPHVIVAYCGACLSIALLGLWAGRQNGRCILPKRKPAIPNAASLRATANAAVDEFGTELAIAPRPSPADRRSSPPPSARPGTAETAETPAAPECPTTPSGIDASFEDGECLICLCDLCVLEADDRVVRLACSHTFHRSCIVRWLSSPTQSGNLPRFNCPLCLHVVNRPLPPSVSALAARGAPPAGPKPGAVAPFPT